MNDLVFFWTMTALTEGVLMLSILIVSSCTSKTDDKNEERMVKRQTSIVDKKRWRGMLAILFDLYITPWGSISQETMLRSPTEENNLRAALARILMVTPLSWWKIWLRLPTRQRTCGVDATIMDYFLLLSIYRILHPGYKIRLPSCLVSRINAQVTSDLWKTHRRRKASIRRASLQLLR